MSGPAGGIVITDRDIKLLQALKYGRLPLSQLYSRAWYKKPEYAEGGRIINPANDDKGTKLNFIKRITKLAEYEYIKKELIPTISTTEERTVLSVGPEGKKTLYGLGETYIRDHPISRHHFTHDIVVSNALFKFDRDIKRYSKIIYNHEKSDEYLLRKLNTGKQRGAIYPDIAITLTLKGEDPTTKEEILSTRMIYVEVDGGTISPKEYAIKLSSLVDSPIKKFEEVLDKHIVFVISNTTDRKRVLLSSIKTLQNRVSNWQNIGIALSAEVSQSGFFSSIFSNCLGRVVSIIGDEEVK